MQMTKNKKLLIIKCLIFLFALIVAFLPSTVARSSEVNSRIVVEMIGLDGETGNELTAQYVMPAESKGSTQKDKVTVKAETLTEAVELLSTTLGRRTDLGQCSVVAVGKDVKPEILGTLMTATAVTADVYLIAAEDKAKDCVGDITDFMKKSGVTDADFIAYGAKKAHIATTTLLHFLSDLGSASDSAFMPVVTVIKEQSQGGASGGDGGSDSSGGGGSNGGSGGGGGSEPQPTGMKVDKLALYNSKKRLGELDKTAARGVAWVSAPIERSRFTADINVNGEIIEDVAAQLVKKSTKIKVNKRGGVTVCVNAKLEPLGDRFNRIQQETDDCAADIVRSGFEFQIKKELEAAYNDSLTLGCDPLFIGRQFYRYEPEYFNEYYTLGGAGVTFEVNVTLK